VGNGRAFRHRRPPPLTDPAPGDPNASFASILQRAAQKIRREDPEGYQRLRVAYLVLFVIPLAAAVAFLIVVAAVRLVQLFL